VECRQRPGRRGRGEALSCAGLFDTAVASGLTDLEAAAGRPTHKNAAHRCQRSSPS